MPIVHCRYGDFFVPDNSDLIFDALRLYGEWAQHEIDLLSRLIQPGAVVIDAGAFIGTHTRAFSQLIGDQGKVHAFEPNPTSYALLLENAKLAADSNIATYQLGLDQNKSTGILLSDPSKGNLGGTSISGSPMGSGGVEICTCRLDDFDFGKIDFIKADIEGMEHSMLLGAEQTIRRYRPVIFLEANNLQASYPILVWARTMDYVPLGVMSSAFNTFNFNQNSDNVFGDAIECGLLLVHKDELAERQVALIGVDYHLIETIDSLAILLRCKPQYLDEVVENEFASKSLVAEAKAKAEKVAHSYMANVLRLQQHLTTLEEAKTRAEELAHLHLASVMQLELRLTAMEEAKTTAEKWAHSHAAEIVELQVRLAESEMERSTIGVMLESVRSSRSYKLLATLNLAPTLRDENV
jgi:FkbM family methyltransferase